MDDYLHRFDNASVFLPADRREELRQEIVEHIEAGLEEADARYAEAVRTVLERLGPPADIVAAEVGGPRSTGSTPVVDPTAPRAAHEYEAGRQERLPQDGVAAPRVSSSPSRRRTMFLVGAAATVVAVGALALGVGVPSSDSGPLPVHEGPVATSPGSEGPGSTSPSEWPTAAGDEPTALPSEVPQEPTASSS